VRGRAEAPVPMQAVPALPPPPTPPVSSRALLDWLAAVPDLLLEFADLPGGGARYGRGFAEVGGGVIRVDRRLFGPALTCAVAEEAGHHATFLAAWRPARVRARRNEEAALRWSASVLIPPDGIRPGDGPADVAARWWLTPEFAERALRALAARGGAA
jgi:hypothetical protein